MNNHIVFFKDIFSSVTACRLIGKIMSDLSNNNYKFCYLQKASCPTNRFSAYSLLGFRYNGSYNCFICKSY